MAKGSINLGAFDLMSNVPLVEVSSGQEQY